MNRKHLIALFALTSLLPATALAQSPWDTAPIQPIEPVDVENTENMQVAEPVSANPVPAEPVVAEPVVVEQPTATAEPAPVEPVAAEPVAVETSTAETTAAEPAAPIEITETSGDVLAMPAPAAAEVPGVLLLDFPRRGMDQDKVQSELGTPVEIKTAVGQPPITRWIYSDRVVYFERSTVLHVVAR